MLLVCTRSPSRSRLIASIRRSRIGQAAFDGFGRADMVIGARTWLPPTSSRATSWLFCTTTSVMVIAMTGVDEVTVRAGAAAAAGPATATGAGAITAGGGGAA